MPQSNAIALALSPYSLVCDSNDRQTWLRQRLRSIGASESSAVLGANPWLSALELWAVKTGETPEADLTGNEAVFWGMELEERIVSGFGKRTNRAVVPFGVLLRSTEWPWLSATPDGLTTDDPSAAKNQLPLLLALAQVRNALKKKDDTAPYVAQLNELAKGWWPLQIKNIGFGSAEHWVDGTPLYYRIQCTQEALVFGATRCTAAALIAGQRLAWDDLDVSREDILARQVVNLTQTFWQDVLDRRRPPPDASESARDTLAAMFPREKPETVKMLGHEEMELAYQRQSLKDQIKQLDEHLQLVENQLKSAIEENERVVFPDGSGFTYKQVNRKGYTVEPKSYRELRFKKAKDGDRGCAPTRVAFDELLDASSLGNVGKVPAAQLVREADNATARKRKKG